MDWYLPDGNPVFWHELRCRLRNGKWYLFIVLDVLVLGTILFIKLLGFHPGGDLLAWSRLSRETWRLLLQIQIILVVFIGQTLTLNAFGRESQQDNAASLFLTPLSSRQIITGKLSAATVLIALFLLTGIPITAILLPLGGLAIWEILLSNTLLLILGACWTIFGLDLSCERKHKGYVLSNICAYGASALIIWYFCRLSSSSLTQLIWADVFMLMGISSSIRNCTQKLTKLRAPARKRILSSER